MLKTCFFSLQPQQVPFSFNPLSGPSHVTSNLRPAPDVIMYFADMQSLGSKVGDARDQLGGSDGRTVQLENGTHTHTDIYMYVYI